MKLRNKETGGLANLIVNKDHFEVRTDAGYAEYSSLAELNEEWEDYEEPKEYWFIDYDGGIIPFDRMKETATDRRMKKLGNYFETREEAKKAVEKLRAWKRLKDANFSFKGWKWIYSGRDDEYYVKIEAEYNGTKEDDLDLLFGGE